MTDDLEAAMAVLGTVQTIGDDHPTVEAFGDWVASQIAADAPDEPVSGSADLNPAAVSTSPVLARPGDVLIVTVSPDTTAQHAAELRERLLAELPELSVVVIGATSTIVHRPAGGTP